MWIALEVKGFNYQYIEVDPYKKPESLLEVNPRGLVPALRHGDWGCYESTVLMEYVRLRSFACYRILLLDAKKFRSWKILNSEIGCYLEVMLRLELIAAYGPITYATEPVRIPSAKLTMNVPDQP